jgi:hypothetical protein
LPSSGNRFAAILKTNNMTTKEIANRLAELCRKGEFDKAQKELYADNAVSIEPMATPEFEKETKGLKAIFEKNAKFESMVQDYHSVNISEPLVAGNSIAFVLDMDITMKGRPREKMSEICLYEVKDGKIVSEQFHM